MELNLTLDLIIVILSATNAVITGLDKNWIALLGWTVACLGFLKCVILL